MHGPHGSEQPDQLVNKVRAEVADEAAMGPRVEAAGLIKVEPALDPPELAQRTVGVRISASQRRFW